MNVIYPIRNVPKCPEEDMILKYSLRSLQRYGTGVEDVYVVGARRHWFSKKIKVIDLDLYKVGNRNPSKFMLVGEKLKYCCQLGQPFILMNDDFILLDDYDTNKEKWFSCGSIADVMEAKHKGIGFKKMLLDSCDRYGKGYDVPNFAVHTPFLVDRPELAEQIVYSVSNRQISFRQSYSLIRGLDQMKEPFVKEMESDCKIYGKQSMIHWSRLFEEKELISFNNDSVADKNLLMALKEKFPEPSIFENYGT